MNNQAIIDATTTFVKQELENTESGHDWWHAQRVLNLAKTIGQSEKTDMFVVHLGALLHDIADSKFYDGDETVGPKKARNFLESHHVAESTIAHVENIIKNISFKGGTTAQTFKSLELDVVQDADRLDAIGAIGIARTFNYGGYKNNPLYIPALKPRLGMSKDEYKNHRGTTINHFYEKLLLLKNRMNTATGKRIAHERHQFMENFLQQFYDEWDGQK